MKKIIYTLLICFLVLIVPFSVNASTTTYTRTETNLRIPSDIKVNSGNKSIILNTPSVNAEEKIYDFAELITDSYEETILKNINKYITDHNMDMIVVTINQNNKYTATAYADDFFDYNYFGKNSSRDGILLLVDMDNREVVISTSGKAQLVYDDARIDKMLDDIYPNLTNKNYEEAVNIFTNEAYGFAKLGVPTSNSKYTIDKNGNYVPINPFPWLMIIAISLVVTAVIMIILLSKHKMVKLASTAKYYIKNLNITNRQDNFINTYTSTVRISSSSSSGGGGSSTHHSSSGRSHGGGSRHF